MTSTAAATANPQQLLAQADVLLLVREVFVEPIAPRSRMDRLPSVDTLDVLFAEAGLVDGGVHARALHPLWTQAVADGGQLLRQAHCDLFEGSTPCPITETAYVRRDKGAILADIAGFYHAFGFEGGELGEKLDHVAVELEFAAVLLIMQARALTDRDAPHAQVADAALRSFTQDHIGEWVLPFCQRLTATSTLPIHHACAALLADAWRAIVATHDLDALTQADRAPANEDEHGPYECGLAEQAVELTANRQPLPPVSGAPKE